MNKEQEPNTPASQTQSKPSLKKKIVIFIIVAGVSAYGTLAYLNRSPSPSNWESIRTDYKNTK